MDKFKVQLNYDQEINLRESMLAISEDNEKHNRTPLYYLTSGAEGCYQLIKICNKIIETKTFDSDHTFIVGRKIWYTHISKFRKRNDWLPEKEKEINYLYDVVYKSFNLYKRFKRDKKIENVVKFKKICEYIFLKYSELIRYILDKDKVYQSINSKDKIYHKDIIKMVMDVGNYSDEEVYFLLDQYIYSREKVA